MLLEKNPKEYLKLITEIYNGDYSNFSKDEIYSILRDYDNESYIYSGGNILHCLSMIMGNKYNKKDNNDIKVYGDDTDISIYLAMEIFDYSVKLGSNLYHYDINGMNPLNFLEHFNNKNICKFTEFVNNYYIHNPPIIEQVSIVDNYYYEIEKIIKNILSSNIEYLKYELWGYMFDKYLELSFDSRAILIDDLIKHYCLNRSKYEKIENITLLIKQIL